MKEHKGEGGRGGGIAKLGVQAAGAIRHLFNSLLRLMCICNVYLYILPAKWLVSAFVRSIHSFNCIVYPSLNANRKPVIKKT